MTEDQVIIGHEADLSFWWFEAPEGWIASHFLGQRCRVDLVAVHSRRPGSISRRSCARIARERGVSFKDALNATLRAGFGTDAGPARQYRLRARSLKLRPGIDLDRALRLVATLEDEEVIRKLELRT